MLESEVHRTLDNSSTESESSESESDLDVCHNEPKNHHPPTLNAEIKELLISNFCWFSVLDNFIFGTCKMYSSWKMHNLVQS